MSRIGNRQSFADCLSAKQQIDNLRYEKSSRAATISGDTDRLAVCATDTTEALNRYSPPGEGEAGRSSGGDSCLWRRTRTLRVSAGWKPTPHDRQDACPTVRRFSDRPGTQGSVLLLALITATIIGIALAGYLWLVPEQDFATTRSLAWNAAMPVAEAGVDEALTQLYYAGVTNLSANSWTSAGTGWFYKERYVDSGSYYQVAIQQADPPVIVSTGYVPAPRSSASYVKRRVRVNTQRQWLFGKGVAAKGPVDLAGNDLSTDMGVRGQFLILAKGQESVRG